MDAKLHKILNSAMEQENWIKIRKSITKKKKKIINTPIMFRLAQKERRLIKSKLQ